MKNFNFFKTIGFVLIFGFISIGIGVYSQSTYYLECGVGNAGNVKYSDDATLGLMDGATDYTIEAWIYPKDGVVEEYDRVLQRWYSFNIVMYDQDNNGIVEDWYFTIMDGSNHYYNTQGDATLTLDAWNHIAVINNSTDGSLKLYVNGVDVTQTGGYANRDLQPSQANDNLYIGSRGSGNIFGGYIDEVRLKNVAEDISNLQTKITDNEYSSDSNTAGLFHFDEGSGTTTVNEASSVNATLYNSPPWRAWDYESGHSLPLDNRYVWNGLTDTDWATVSNWDPGVLPGSSDNIIIPSVTNNPLLDDGTTASCNNLDIKSGAVLSIRGQLTVSGTLTNNSGTSGLIIKADASGNGSLIEGSGVSATVQQHISADDWHLVSIPVTSAQAVVYKGLYLYEWSESDSVFTNIVDSTYNLTVTYGYYAYSQSAISSPTDIEFKGSLNTGDKPVSWMTYTSQNYTGQDGWNLAGNPYPSGLKWDNTWSQSGLTPTVYVFDAAGSGNWLHYNYTPGSTGNTLPDGEIPPTQGFFVWANAANPSMTIPNSARVHTSNTFYKESEIQNDVLRLNITCAANSYSDNLFVGINSDASNGFDDQFDAYKIMGLEAAPQLYSIDSESKYSVDIIPEFTGSKSIPVAFKAGVSSEYTINAEGLENFNNEIEVYLEDKTTGEMINLRENPIYIFLAGQGLDESRFVLHFNPDLTDVDPESLSVKANIYSFNKTVFINYDAQSSGEVTVFDLAGKIVANKTVNQGRNEIEINTPGYYLVKVISSSFVKTQKVYIQ